MPRRDDRQHPRHSTGLARRACALALALGGLTAAAHPAACLEILFTAETSFQPLPCDCPIEPLGGWAQRSGLIRSIRSADASLLVDAGGWLAGGINEEAARLTSEAMWAASYDVINVGPADLPLLATLDPAVLKELPLVCGTPERPAGTAPWRTVKRDGRTIAVVGAGWFGEKTKEPADQVKAALASCPAADVVVVLCAGGLGPARTIAARCPRVDVVVYGEGAKTPEVVDLGGAFGAAPGTKGRYVGKLELGEGKPVLDLEPVHADIEGPHEIEKLALRAVYAQEGPGYLNRRFAYSEE